MKVESRGLNELIESLNNVSTNLPVDIYASLNEAAKKTKRSMGKEVTSELNIAQKVVKKQIKVRKDRENLRVICSLSKSWRVPLRDFKPTQTKKGVTARLMKGGKRVLYPGAFIVKKFGGHVYTRQKTGERGPILKMKTASPFGILENESNGSLSRVVETTSEAIRYELADRIRYLELKRAGGLNWQQSQGE